MTSEKDRKLVRSSQDDAPPPKRQTREEVSTGRELPDSEMEESSLTQSFPLNLSNDGKEYADQSNLDLIRSLQADISVKIAQLAKLGVDVPPITTSLESVMVLKTTTFNAAITPSVVKVFAEAASLGIVVVNEDNNFQCGNYAHFSDGLCNSCKFGKCDGHDDDEAECGNVALYSDGLYTGSDEVIENPFQNLFVVKALFELSRQRLFEAVHYLSAEILQYIKKVPQRNKQFNLVGLGKMFFVYSNIDKLRHALVGEEGVPSILDTVQTLMSNRTIFDLLNGTGHLAASLNSFYHFFCDKEELPPEEADKVMADCIKMMEVYANCKSSSLNLICYTCNDKDTKGYEVFVCQGVE